VNLVFPKPLFLRAFCLPVSPHPVIIPVFFPEDITKLECGFGHDEEPEFVRDTPPAGAFPLCLSLISPDSVPLPFFFFSFLSLKDKFSGKVAVSRPLFAAFSLIFPPSDSFCVPLSLFTIKFVFLSESLEGLKTPPPLNVHSVLH